FQFSHFDGLALQPLAAADFISVFLVPMGDGCDRRRPGAVRLRGVHVAGREHHHLILSSPRFFFSAALCTRFHCSRAGRGKLSSISSTISSRISNGSMCATSSFTSSRRCRSLMPCSRRSTRPFTSRCSSLPLGSCSGGNRSPHETCPAHIRAGAADRH